MLTPWEQKAHRLIAELARQEFERSNRLPNGRLRARHKPYSLPPVAQQLVEILGLHDRTEAEHRAKSIFLDFEYLKEI